MATQTALIGIGSNMDGLGMSPDEIVASMEDELAMLGPVLLSRLYDSPAWPDPSAPPYVNAVARLETAHPPDLVLRMCQGLERAHGRVRDPNDRNAARPLDLDILAFGGAVSDEASLTLPHPRLADRDFVLLPLREVAPDWRHPVTGKGASAMIGALAEVTATPRATGPRRAR